jgi:hypothetical protein
MGVETVGSRAPRLWISCSRSRNWAATTPPDRPRASNEGGTVKASTTTDLDRVAVHTAQMSNSARATPKHARRDVEHQPQSVMNVLQVQMMVLRFDVFLFESRPLHAVIEQRRLLVSDNALSACELSLFMQEATQFACDGRVRSRSTERQADYACGIDADCRRADSFVGVTWQCGRFRRFDLRFIFRHGDSSALDPKLQNLKKSSIYPITILPCNAAGCAPPGSSAA